MAARRYTLFAMLGLSMALWSCGPTKFHLLSGTDWPNPPTDAMSVFVQQESDLADTYRDLVDAFGIVSARETLISTLSNQKVPYLFLPTEEGEPLQGTTKNFLSVTADSSQADLIVSLVVVAFGYDRLTEAKDAIGQPADEDPDAPEPDTNHGYILLSGYVTERESQRVLHSFDGVGLSEAGLARRDALQQAVDEGVERFVARMLQSTL